MTLIYLIYKIHILLCIHTGTFFFCTCRSRDGWKGTEEAAHWRIWWLWSAACHIFSKWYFWKELVLDSHHHDAVSGNMPLLHHNSMPPQVMLMPTSSDAYSGTLTAPGDHCSDVCYMTVDSAAYLLCRRQHSTIPTGGRPGWEPYT